MRHWKSFAKFHSCIAAAIVCSVASFSGCGKSTTYPIVSASGTVTYEDGSIIPAERIQIKFYSQEPPLDKKTHPRQGIGEVNAEDGSFVVSTYDYGDGLIQGKHNVTVRSYKLGNIPSGEVPNIYSSPESSPIEVDAAESPFKLVIKRP